MNKRWGSFVVACFMLIVGVLTPNVKAQAIAYTVTPTSVVLYSNANTVVYADADLQAQIVTTLEANLPINVVGITSNGWFQISIGAIYYVQGSALHVGAASSNTNGLTTKQRIQSTISGTFSYYTKVELDGFSKKDIENMSVNEYIKYLDSYLAGKSNISAAIIRDTGLTAQREYDTKLALHASMTATNVVEYVLAYREAYLADSFWGPVDTVGDVKVCVNRAIRYNVSNFTVVCHEYEIGDNEVSMKSRLNKMLQQVKDEQGIHFTATQSYGTFQDQKGNSSSGWVIEITRGTE